MQTPEHNARAGRPAATGAGSARPQKPRERVAAKDVEEALRIGTERRHALLSDVAAGEPELQELNNALMDCFREHGDVDAYALLYRLNVTAFSRVAANVMRISGCRVDIHDVMQEAFVAIYRYPSRFRPEKKNAFRNWSYSIIRNTVYRHAQGAVRDGTPVETLAEVLADESTASPPSASIEAEADARCRRAYALLLGLYREIYEHELRPREQFALQLVEHDGVGYRDAAELMEVRLENFKMIVCRARKRIAHALVRVLGTRPS